MWPSCYVALVVTPRWDFRVAEHAEGRARRAELERLVAAWWSAFADRAGALRDLFARRSQWDLPAWMSETLQAVDAGLMWEFGPALRTKGHRLVITPESRRDLRPLVRYVLRQAPALDGWEFYAHRVPESLAVARKTVAARCKRPSELSEVAIVPGEHHRIDLRFSGPHVTRDEDAAQNEAFVLAETLLGEEVLDCWIGAISVHPPPKRGFLGLLGKGRADPTSVPLEEMKAKVDASIASLRGQCRDAVEVSERDAWILLELKPDQQDDYAGQRDLLVAKTPNLELWRATRDDGFFDARFTRLDEKFCYIKLDGLEGLDGEKFKDKGEIEDAVDDLLKPAGWGCQIGGGTGLRYSYIELALKNCDEALPAIRKRLAEGNVPKRSWILFHHCEQTTEWVGVYDDSPPPP